jgi:membrane protein
MRFLRVLRGAVTDFWRQGSDSLAAALAFFSLLSFFPLIFLLFYGMGVVLRHHDASEVIINLLRGFLPSLGPDLAEEIRRVGGIDSVRWVLVMTAVWFGMQVFLQVEYAVNVIFGTSRKRHPLLSTAFSAALLCLVGILFFLSYLLTQVFGLMVVYAPSFARLDFAAVVTYRFLLSYLLPFAMVLVAVTGLYRFLPQKRPRWRHAFIGGLVFSFLLEVAKHLFSDYVLTLAVYSRMYGSLLVGVLFLLWIYYSAMLFLFGAAVVYQLETKGERRAS